MHYVQLQSVQDSWTDGLLVLMYHSVDRPPLFHGLRGLYVTPRHLARQVEELQAAGSISFSTLSDWIRARPPGRHVALTFDDAYRNLCVKGLPVLQKANTRAITYVVGSLIGKTNEWDRATDARTEPLMDRGQLAEWLQAGHEIGSHGMTHRHLTRLSPDAVRREIVDSKKLLEDLFGRPVHHFCYPYGDRNEEISDMVAEAGYETASSTVQGFNTAVTDAFTLQRLLASHHRPYLAALTGR